MKNIMNFDWISASFLFGVLTLILTYLSKFRKELLKDALDYLKIFLVGGLIYPIISSSYYVATSKPFWNDTISLYRITTGAGIIFYIYNVMNLYKSNKKRR